MNRRLTVLAAALLTAAAPVSSAALAASAKTQRVELAQATQSPAATTQPGGVPAGVAGTAAPAVDVTGFRSATFGMSEKEVRAAIASDFGKETAEKVIAQENLAEKTKVISVLVPDLFEGAGIGSVSYVFGYQSKSLIQVALLWSAQTDPKMTPEQLFSGANVLQGYFLAQGYPAGSVASNAMIDAGILMFRGNDKDENTTMLLLQGGFTGEGEQRNLMPNALLLYYIADAKNPDVFRIPAGKF
jgi:hypothetical protein